MHQPDQCLAHERILVVEDEPTCRDAVKIFLQAAGAIVTDVPSGEEALKQAATQAFDTIITDLRLEGMDGIELLKQLRSLGHETPVIIMTGYASMQSAISAMKLGADDYLIKPITKADSIVRATRNAIDRLHLRTQNAMLRGQLLETELSFKTIFDHTADMVFSFPLTEDGLPGQLEQCNMPATRMLGHSQASLHRMTLLDLLAQSHRKDAAAYLARLPVSDSCRFETMFIKADGAPLPVELSCHVLAAEERLRVMSIARNLSAHVEAEAQFANTLEDERAQLGRELHDAVCQDLISITMLAGSEPEQADIESIRSAASSAMISARDLSKGLLPSFENAADLHAAVEELLLTHKERYGITFSCEISGPVSLRGDNGMLHLFRIIQEAANNTVKHGKARHIAVKLVLEDGLHKLTITDDGKEHLVEQENAGGMGKLIMRQRARILGASLSISDNGEGTTVECCWQNGNHENN